ncbi:BsuPI-related putative proteinase inhibitor [Halorubrum sp. DTA46]|uniref:BsuPI-related putative proteinase inhibitor n=1 Tax=Halorubrum sp. DTA46 TaxID=3402162 RepID=UPI003AAB9907
MLDTELAVTGRDGGVDLALTVTNAGDDPITLRFRTGQRAEFAAYAISDADPDADACEEFDPVDIDPIWRHGAGRMFTQALGTETLKPGDSATYEGRWSDPPAGTYRIVGTLTADDAGPTATATVTI